MWKQIGRFCVYSHFGVSFYVGANLPIYFKIDSTVMKIFNVTLRRLKKYEGFLKAFSSNIVN